MGVGGLGEGVGYPMLSVPWCVSPANLGGSISRPTGFSADPLLQCSNTKIEGDILIPISPVSLSHLILNLDGYHFTPLVWLQPKPWTIASADKDLENWSPHILLMGMENGGSALENSSAGPQEFKHRIIL